MIPTIDAFEGKKGKNIRKTHTLSGAQVGLLPDYASINNADAFRASATFLTKQDHPIWRYMEVAQPRCCLPFHSQVRPRSVVAAHVVQKKP